MAKTPIQYLILSLALMVIGFADIHGAIFWGVAKPLGVVFFIVFLMTHFMDGEVQKYEEECRSRLKTFGKHNA